MNAAQIICTGENTRRTGIRAEPQGLQTSIRFTYRFSSKHASDTEVTSFNSVLINVYQILDNSDRQKCVETPTNLQPLGLRENYLTFCTSQT